ncbi:FAD:protein FMN transferase [Marinospirillum sp.]|uniref:FAD:protein FMN transferase n=1 Tax=Marinospirillum sp. TaxID=2183934 RepID=UPI0028701577|nr:FAD:protein FMN transferase [Marinospirillum sp.]MDR9468009.1 FAD:protein FMN transferase [Marinospirillum sp.]
MAEFSAMASPCELLMALPQERKKQAEQLAHLAAKEVWRIEKTYSRYRQDNLFTQLHRHPDQPQRVDAETARLLNFADQAWQLSEGLFDITSGILRQVWTFDGSDHLPSPDAVKALLPQVGWGKLNWQSDTPTAEGEVAGGWLTLPSGMELDFGGLGKEYAADRALGLMMQQLEAEQLPLSSQPGLLVNLGGDLACSGPADKGKPWRVGVESPAEEDQASLVLEISRGGMATSGDSRRYLIHQGKRYSHLLDPRTGWPLEDAPRSVTVAAPSCVQSGLVASLALLQGSGAKVFLQETGLKHWILE